VKAPAIEKQFSRQDARKAWDVSVEGVQLLRERIAQHSIGMMYCQLRDAL
jgi:gamma-glutamylputrescine oxidase